ncbi:GNAT family N-acetyltransferase [Amycolatopsis magusensis]|uniref:GNAT superfamily N-acetyltransferase n=1 Tax=Amycolatopsis magusensis TaxID=882444 RepID=A0ABS4PYF9_9PSEU|nr:GNAT family N-acetyltransferase [Amycolatopsis magusensis]MBP2183893.1 GNAT superfamily N-acetyltransferase [Amycolatopsis magusensis]
MTEQKLIRGWPSGTAGVRIRLATAEDIPVIAELAPASGIELGAAMTEAIRDGVMGSAHRAGLAGRGREHGRPTFSRAIARAFTDHGPDHAFAVASLVLVAEHREHGVIGTVIAFPPPNVAEQYMTHAERTGAAVPEVRKLILVGIVGLVKVAVFAVAEPHRGSGIGAALLSRVKKIFFAHGYFFVYGQIRPDRPGLAAFYRRQGFEVRAPDEGLDLWVVFGIPGGIHPDQGEQFFVRARPRDE